MSLLFYMNFQAADLDRLIVRENEWADQFEQCFLSAVDEKMLVPEKWEKIKKLTRFWLRTAAENNCAAGIRMLAGGNLRFELEVE